MNNIKKIGLTALAASLVSTSAFAGEMTVSGSASMAAEGHSSVAMNSGTTFSMGNQLTFSGSGELDNGLSVSLSFILDQGDDATTVAPTSGTKHSAGGPFDSHSVSISSDALGTLVFHGEGGSSAASALDTTAAGDIWDNFDGVSGGGTKGVAVSDTAPGDNSLFYTLPSLVDGLTVNASYKPQGSGAESAVGFAGTYSGVEGLSVSYGTTELNSGTASTSGDQDVLKASYAYGPITLAYSNSDYDVGAGDATTNQETTSMAVSYTVSDAISVTYGTEEIDKGSEAVDAEYDKISASYTAGGMTISATMADGENVAHGTNANEDIEYWSLGLSFAF
ncbi:porin [Candidatus Pelagibacter ubique]|nr:porin [Candidatus Pelagibacter ubique]